MKAFGIAIMFLMARLPHWFFLTLIAIEFIAPAIILTWATRLFDPQNTD